MTALSVGTTPPRFEEVGCIIYTYTTSRVHGGICIHGNIVRAEGPWIETKETEKNDNYMDTK